MNKLVIIGLAVLSALPSTIDSKKINRIVPIKEEKQEEVAQELIETTYTTRLTSYYANDGYGTGNTTASGLSTNNFQISENGWYTYQDKLVIATASKRLGYTEMRTYNLYDEITLNIDGVDYQAIVVDVCGACQRNNRIDLFVSGAWAVKDTQITVKE